MQQLETSLSSADATLSSLKGILGQQKSLLDQQTSAVESQTASLTSQAELDETKKSIDAAHQAHLERVQEWEGNEALQEASLKEREKSLKISLEYET